jgi:hypothetical protein
MQYNIGNCVQIHYSCHEVQIIVSYSKIRIKVKHREQLM